jgi:hypothetical protein
MSQTFAYSSSIFVKEEKPIFANRRNSRTLNSGVKPGTCQRRQIVIATEWQTHWLSDSISNQLFIKHDEKNHQESSMQKANQKGA